MTYLDEVANVSINDICDYLTEHKKAISINNIQIIIESLLDENVLTEELLQEKNVFKIGKELVTRPIARMKLANYLNKHPVLDSNGDNVKVSPFDNHKYIERVLNVRFDNDGLTKDTSYDLDDTKVEKLNDKDKKIINTLNNARNLLNRPLIPRTTIFYANGDELRYAQHTIDGVDGLGNGKNGKPVFSKFTMYDNGPKKVAISHGKMKDPKNPSAGNVTDNGFNTIINNPEKYAGNTDKIVTCYGGASKLKKYHILKNGGGTYPTYIGHNIKGYNNEFDSNILPVVATNDIDEGKRVAKKLSKKFTKLKEKNPDKYASVMKKDYLNSLTPEDRVRRKEYDKETAKKEKERKTLNRSIAKFEKKNNAFVSYDDNGDYIVHSKDDPFKYDNYEKEHDGKFVYSIVNGKFKANFVKNKHEEPDSTSKQNNKTKD